ncbi:HFL142Wp [Eremothecium sinecaudum]|uniref:Phospholipid-transporting ATPase n=1 Tax=Eremothecium sinecaudum TaxID=45286 RepID=A0A0X8HUL3_9SACH|nr:HFL142Wp [Eremothecium sinecaudum]AMD21714.1 HFL142Wp [Eremothecium sinecaudum]
MGNRRRSKSLRTQLFNRNLYDQWKQQENVEGIGNETGGIPLGDIPESQAVDNNAIAKTKGDDIWSRIAGKLFCKACNDRERKGRTIPLCLCKRRRLDEKLERLYDSSRVLLDERTNKPYVKNDITSSRYTIYSFLPRQLYAQFSKLANAFFYCIALLQMVPTWSTTGNYTTIIPLSIFMSISIAREGWDDYKRHKLDKVENDRLVKVLVVDVEDSECGSATLNSKLGENKSFADEALLQSYGVSIVQKPWKSISVGDFILLNQDDWVPADLMLLTADGENDCVYVETMALDGETNLKCKQPVPDISSRMRSAEGLINFTASVTVEDPDNNLYNFDGNVEFTNSNKEKKMVPIGLDNVVFRGSIVRNTNALVGMVVFTGEETKIRMNSIKNPRIKAPKLQTRANWIVLFLIIVVVSLAVLSLGLQRYYKRRYVDNNNAWYLWGQDAGIVASLVSYIIMYNTMIPLSLYVTMEIIKTMQSRLMMWDIDMYHPESNTPFQSRTNTILEELGQVSYIFSDKTGTLTENKMVLKRFSICGSSWTHEVENGENGFQKSAASNDVDVISVEDDNSIGKNFEITEPEPRTSVECKGTSSVTYSGRPSIASQIEKLKFEISGARKKEENNYLSSVPSVNATVTSSESRLKSTSDLILYVQSHPRTFFAQRVKMFMLSLALCHTCLPKKVSDDADDADSIEYQASSPDELALVMAARDMGFVFLNRNTNIFTIKTFPNGFEKEPLLEDYEILDVIEFNSTRKRMSVLVRVPNVQDKVLLICKGADNVILERLQNSEMALEKTREINISTTRRKTEEADLVLQHRRQSMDQISRRDSIGDILRNSISGRPTRGSWAVQAASSSYAINPTRSLTDQELHINSIDDFLNIGTKADEEADHLYNASRKSLSKQQREKYSRKVGEKGSSPVQVKKSEQGLPKAEYSEKRDSLESYIGSDELVQNEEYVLERTLYDIDSFSTEGLRTLLYSFKWVSQQEYQTWSARYQVAKTSIVDRRELMDSVGGSIEFGLRILGVSAIEDKLQEGVSEAIVKLRRAGIKLWMLTGDKRETAINIGYSCKLIRDYSSVVVLSSHADDMTSKITALIQQLDEGNVAHCVVVIDGATLATFEENPILMALFVELCTKTDSVICCRASPAQKALMVENIRKTDKKIVTLAVGDGANDIAMIQSADIGIGITGKEGLQAARSSDYSISQFRYLLKLLLVHGRYNYIRTTKFMLCTFYKELIFFIAQQIYQRNVMFSGTSLYEPWSLTMFNTLFTSLTVLCIGMFEKDLKPMTLLAVPELYSLGRLSQAFNMFMFLRWMLAAAANSVLICFLSWYCWGFTSLSDNTLYPMGTIIYTAIVILINVKFQFLEMNSRTWLAFGSVFISIIAWFLWCSMLPKIYRQNFSTYDVKDMLYHTIPKDYTFWLTIVIAVALPLILNIVFLTLRTMLWPTDSNIFYELEHQDAIRKKLELNAFNELKQGWTWQRDPPAFFRWSKKILGHSKENSSVVSNSSLSIKHTGSEPNESALDTPKATALENNAAFDSDEFEQLPSGKLIKRKKQGPNGSHENLNEGLTARIGRKLRLKSKDEDINEIINQRLRSLE